MTDIDYPALAREAGLKRVGERPPLGAYVAEAWRRRDFAYTIAKYRIQAKLGQHYLGLAWVVLQPILTAAMYGLVFGIIMPSDSRPDNFVPFLVAGIFIFQYFSHNFLAGARTVRGDAGLVQSLSFPRILLPLSLVIENTLLLIPQMAVMLIILVAFGEPITWAWLLLPVPLAIMSLFCLGVAQISARAAFKIPDLLNVFQTFNRLVFYGSGIFYSLDLVLADQPKLLFLVQFNPVHDYISIVRGLVVSGNPMFTIQWVIAIAAAVVTLVGGTIYFWLAEEDYGNV
ncbi:ABC transporter permease [Demequina subtropica]|uniref:ABC transporter permease n=1 Tax=Demequina subtropica TaxID=1638989 RepID=UPI000782158F|nr:ABC transporter permease [Demequina subtropica]